jgi:hypothetical protein
VDRVFCRFRGLIDRDGMMGGNSMFSASESGSMSISIASSSSASLKADADASVSLRDRLFTRDVRRECTVSEDGSTLVKTSYRVSVAVLKRGGDIGAFGYIGLECGAGGLIGDALGVVSLEVVYPVDTSIMPSQAGYSRHYCRDILCRTREPTFLSAF